MSDRLRTGFALLKAVLQAQWALGEMDGQTGPDADAEWRRRNDVLCAAKLALEDFEASSRVADFKMKQAGE